MHIELIFSIASIVMRKKEENLHVQSCMKRFLMAKRGRLAWHVIQTSVKPRTQTNAELHETSGLLCQSTTSVYGSEQTMEQGKKSTRIIKTYYYHLTAVEDHRRFICCCDAIRVEQSSILGEANRSI